MPGSTSPETGKHRKCRNGQVAISPQISFAPLKCPRQTESMAARVMRPTGHEVSVQGSVTIRFRTSSASSSGSTPPRAMQHTGFEIRIQGLVTFRSCTSSVSSSGSTPAQHHAAHLI